MVGIYEFRDDLPQSDILIKFYLARSVKILEFAKYAAIHIHLKLAGTPAK